MILLSNGPGGRSAAGVGLRFETPLARQNLIGADVSYAMGQSELKVVWPGEPEKSALYLRLVSAEPSLRMPLQEYGDPDRAGIEVIAEWIRSLGSTTPEH